MTFLLHAQRIITYKEKKYSKHYTYQVFLYMLDNAIMLFVDDKGGETYELINTMS